MIHNITRPLGIEFLSALYYPRTEPPGFLSTDGILSRFTKSRPKAQSRYRRFVRAGKKKASPWKALKEPYLLGGRDCIEKLPLYLRQKTTFEEIRRVDRQILRPDPAQLFSETNLVSKSLRNRAMRAAYFEHGYRPKEIADHLGLHDTTVSNILREIR